MIKTFIYRLLIVIFLICGSLSADAQTKEKPEKPRPFLKVPGPLRKRLVSRLKLRTKYERSHNFGGVYDLLFVTWKNVPRTKYVSRRKEQFSRQLEGAFVGFEPTCIAGNLQNDGYYMIFGKSKWSEGGSISEVPEIILAYWLRGEWYFSEFGLGENR